MKINGVEVEDANAKLVVKITKQDIRKGALKNANACAAANALCRQHQLTPVRRERESRDQISRGSERCLEVVAIDGPQQPPLATGRQVSKPDSGLAVVTGREG